MTTLIKWQYSMYLITTDLIVFLKKTIFSVFIGQDSGHNMAELVLCSSFTGSKSRCQQGQIPFSRLRRRRCFLACLGCWQILATCGCRAEVLVSLQKHCDLEASLRSMHVAHLHLRTSSGCVKLFLFMESSVASPLPLALHVSDSCQRKCSF